MKREDVAKIFEGATEEQISGILDINSADIGKAKGDYDALKAKLGEAKETIQTLTAEAEALKNSGRFIPWQVVTISTDGQILES